MKSVLVSTGALLLLIFFVKCNKRELTSSKTSASNVTNCIPCAHVTVMTNPNNGYDTIGARHNNGCSYLLGQLNPSSTTLTNDIVVWDKKFLVNNGFDTTIYNSDYNYITTNNYYHIPDTVYTTNPNSLASLLYTNGKITLKTKNYLVSLNQSIDTTIGSSTPDQTVYNTAAQHLINIENAIVADTTLASTEKQALLSTASTYRYSLAFWGTYLLGSGTTTVNLFGIHLHWGGFGHADASGALAGAIGGAIADPATPLIGGALGAIGGGLGSSIAHLFFGGD